MLGNEDQPGSRGFMALAVTLWLLPTLLCAHALARVIVPAISPDLRFEPLQRGGRFRYAEARWRKPSIPSVYSRGMGRN